MSGITFSPASATVYTTVTGSFLLDEPDCEKLFIDWGDGIDRTLANGVNQWIDLEVPASLSKHEHTYTKTGTFSPIIRTVNRRGFVSKYFGSGATNTELLPYESAGARINGITISDTIPLGVIKIENKNVLSGIDNNIFKEGPKTVYIQPAPLIASGASTDLTDATLKLKVECLVAVASNTNKLDVGYETAIHTIEKTFTLNDRQTTVDAIALSSNKKIIEILKVTLVTAKLDVNDTLLGEFNQLKIFLIAKGNDGNFYPITYISNGDPIKNSKDNRRITRLDFSQSRAAASNVTLSNFYYDSGKVFWEPSFQWQASSSTAFTDTTRTGDTFVDKQYTYYPRPDGLKGTNYINTVSSSAALYSGNAWLYDGNKDDYVRNQFLINEFNQFYDSFHLVRMTVTAGSESVNNLDTFNFIYRVRPPALSTGSTAYFINQTTGSQELTTNAYYNTEAYPVSTSSWANVSFEDSAGNARQASSYFVLGDVNKVNKIFFNNSAYAENLMTNLSGMSGVNIQGVYYLRLSNEKFNDKFTQKAEWVPLRFTDTTKIEKLYRDSNVKDYTTKSSSLAKDGYITFDMPSDWSKASIQNLCGGFFNMSGAAESAVNTIGDYSIALPALTVKGTDDESPFKIIRISGAAVSANLANYTDEQIKGYKYLIQVSGGADQSQVYWVASGNISTNYLYLVSGTDMTTGDLSGTEDFIMRRINIYDVFDGASRTSETGSPPNFANNPGTAYPYNFMFGGTEGGPSIRPGDVSGSFQDIYPLKIVLSGNTLNNTSATTTPPNQEIWNILPFNSSSAQTIVQKDNTAYDLNYMAITSDVNITYAGTFYQAVTKGGRVFIVRTGTPIQTIGLGGTAMGDETSFSFSDNYTSYYTLRKIRRAQSRQIRVMWDEQQKDGTYVRFFGFISNVSETHKVTGKRATRPFNFSLIVQEICLLDINGNIMSEIEPLGGIPDGRNFI